MDRVAEQGREPGVTLITGGGSGIGAATARRLIGLGQRVAIMGRRAERLDDVAAELGKPPQLLTIAGDASDWDAVRGAVESTVDAFGGLDAVVANAGFATHDSLGAGDPTGWRDMVLTNVLGPALLIRAAVPALTASRGRIVLVGSVAGFVHSAGNIYGATKWAITGMAENARRELTERGIGVTLIAPGRTLTRFWDNFDGLPDGELLSPEQIADTIVWAMTQPAPVDINTVTVRPIGQPV